VAVSVYEPRDVCYDAVAKLIAAGVRQVTIHQLVAEETFERALAVIADVRSDPRLVGLSALLFLTLKPKGARNTYHPIRDVARYRTLVETARAAGINIGFDSCAAPLFLAAVADRPDFHTLATMTESCESDRFSGYANVRGQYWHCSFTEGVEGFSPVDLLAVTDFARQAWASPAVAAFRARLLRQDNRHIGPECYLCPVYDLYDPALGNASGHHDRAMSPTHPIASERAALDNQAPSADKLIRRTEPRPLKEDLS
jgi:hypothetical protein